MIFSKKILNQDRRVVVTQLPIKTELKMGEKLIQGALPIITYRRIREDLKTQNPQAAVYASDSSPLAHSYEGK